MTVYRKPFHLTFRFSILKTLESTYAPSIRTHREIIFRS
jgi:hypothetical protein